MMMRLIKRFILILFVLVIFFSINFKTQVEADSTSVVYLSAAEYDYPPFSIENNGQADGFSIQLLKAVAVEMGITIEFKMDFWSIIKQELIDGQLDVLPLVGYTPERDEVLDFTVPYIVMRGNIFVRDGEKSIQSAEDLIGKQVLVLSGDNSEEYAHSIGLFEELTATTTYTEAFLLLASGQFDAILAQGLVGEKIISDEKISNVSPVYVYDNDGISRIKLNLEGYEQKFCFAVTEGNHELLSILNEGLSIVSANGTYDQLYQTWFPFLIDNSTSWEDVLGITLSILVPLIILILAFSVWIIRKQVKNQTAKIVKASTSNQVILEAFEKKFNSDLDRYDYFLVETLKLSESTDGIMFTLNKNGKIEVNNFHFGQIEPTCSRIEMEAFIENFINESPNKIHPVQLIFNDFHAENYFSDVNIACLDHIRHAAILSFHTESDKMFYTLIANKQTPYTEEDLTQISILIAGFVSMIDRSDYLKQIEYLSYHDSLTDLYNRRFVEEKMKGLSHGSDYPIAVLFADVNRLKEVNDTFGHALGDALLKKTGELIISHCNKKDIVARWGGDEFVVIKPNTTQAQVKQFINHVSEATMQTDLGIGSISIAFGYCMKQDSKMIMTDCLVEAEKMMYQNKQDMMDQK